MAERVERRLAAILAADIVGYSRLVEQDEAGTLAAIKALRKRAIDPLLAEHHGRIVKLMGDGAIAEFTSVVDAVACAVAVQKAVTEARGNVPPDRRIVFRIGINLGDVVVEGDDLLGDGVNVAARLEQLCEPGGVWSPAVRSSPGPLRAALGFTGEQQVKNLAGRCGRIGCGRIGAGDCGEGGVGSPAAGRWGPRRRRCSRPPAAGWLCPGDARAVRKAPRRRRGGAGPGHPPPGGAAVHQHQRRRQGRMVRRRHHRGDDRPALQHPRAERHRPDLDHGLQGDQQGRRRDRPRAGRRDDSRGQRAARRRSGPRHRPAHRQPLAGASLGRELRPADGRDLRRAERRRDEGRRRPADHAACRRQAARRPAGNHGPDRPRPLPEGAPQLL